MKEECSRAAHRARHKRAQFQVFALGAVLFELQKNLQAITPLDAQPAALSLATAGENKKKMRE
jgi:hypothetical protein